MKCIRIFYVMFLVMLADQGFADKESRWFPTEHLYPFYLADPYEMNFHMKLQSYSESTIAQTGSSRWDLMLGAPLIFYEQKDNTGVGWQAVFLAGLRSQFDNSNNQDSIAWEGLFGLQGVFRVNKDFAWHIGTKHYSSHVGDEYIERTGRTRIQYTREEWRAGMAWKFKQYFTAYSDIGYAFTLRNKALQERGRIQLGLQYEKPGLFMNGNVGWYTALDISAFEENEWNNNITLQFGFDMPMPERRWRLGLEYYDGRSQYGEFFQDQESYVSIGLWMDL